MSEGKINEHILIWNSAYRDNWEHNNAGCAVGYPTHHWLSDTLSFAVKSVTLTNMFPNVYGQNAILWFKEREDQNDVHSCVVVPNQHVETVEELASLIQACLDSTFTVGWAAVTVNADGYIVITSVTNDYLVFLTQQEVYRETGNRTSMNLLMGMNSNMVVKDNVVPLIMPDKPNLTGVRKVRISTTMGASSNSIHPSGDIGDMITSLSLHDVDFGFSKTYEYDSSENARHIFEGNRDCSRLDIFLHDEYDQILELPENAPVDIEFTVTSRTT